VAKAISLKEQSKKLKETEAKSNSHRKPNSLTFGSNSSRPKHIEEEEDDDDDLEVSYVARPSTIEDDEPHNLSTETSATQPKKSTATEKTKLLKA
jgi:hypothetical protein